MTDNIKQKINNEIVSMRNTVRQTKVHLIHKLTRSVKQLRAKKGTEEQKLKNSQKADKYVQEISTIKKLNVDNVSKYALTVKHSLTEILASVNSTSEERALARLCLHKILSTSVNKIKNKYEVIEPYITPAKKIKSTNKIKKPKSEKSQMPSQITETNDSKEKVNMKSDENIDEFKVVDNAQKINSIKSKEIDKSNISQHEQVKQRNKRKLDHDNQENNEKRELKIKSNQTEPIKICEKLDSVQTIHKIKSNSTKPNENLNVDQKPIIPTNKNINKSLAVKSKINLSELKDVETLDSILQLEKKVCSSSKKQNSLKGDKSVDSFFLSGNNDSDFLHVTVQHMSDNKIEHVEKKSHNDQLGLNRKQRRSRMFNQGNVFNNHKNSRSNGSGNDFYLNVNKFNEQEFSQNIKTVPINEKDELHPSWQAKKMLKPQIIEFQGKKITFDD